MARFLKNILIFLIPIWLIIISLLSIFFIAKSTGELDSIENNSVIQRNNRNCIIGLGYNEQTSYYKLLNANKIKAPIISLGTSRVMQFKEFFFSTDFYNCGGAVNGNYHEYINFLKNLDYKPETIIIGLDAWVFNNAWNYSCDSYEDFSQVKETERGTLPLLKSILIDAVKRKWTLKDLQNYPYNIGFNGRVKDAGFMIDGSYYYGYIYRNPAASEDYEFIDTLDRISKGNNRFEWGEHIDEDTINQLSDLLNYCQNEKIHVIGFLAPFAPSIYEAMDNNTNYNYISEIAPACSYLFNNYGYEFYDYLDSKCLNVTDDYFVDGFHGSEVVYSLLLKDMNNNGSIVQNYIDIDRINDLIDNSYSPLVFEDPALRD